MSNMRDKLVDIKVKDGKVCLFIKGKEAKLNEFNSLAGKDVTETKARYSLTDSEYMTACFEIRRSLHD